MFPMLGVEENLLVAERNADRHGWNLDRVYKLFLRLHERRHVIMDCATIGQSVIVTVSFLQIDAFVKHEAASRH